MPSVADICLAPLLAFGAAFWVFIGAGIVMAIRRELHHRHVHRQLGITDSHSADCPMCIEEDEQNTTTFSDRYARNKRRERLKREEFND